MFSSIIGNGLVPHEDLPSGMIMATLWDMSVEEIETAMARLSGAELERFSEWFEVFAAEQWDRKIEADVKAGRFDAAGRDADKDFEAGRCKPL
jgi:hypothetical protein